jgi:hypothetical protein
MLIDLLVATAVVLAAATIVAFCLTYSVVLAAAGLAVFDVVMSELLAARFKLTGLVLALLFAFAAAILAHTAIISIAAADWGPDLMRQFFAPLTAGAAMACAAAVIHYARYRAPFTLGIAIAAALYAGFGALKLTFGNAWLHL